MSIISFLAKISKTVINNIDSILKGSIIITLLYFYLFISLLITTNFNKKPDPVLDYLKALDLKILILYLLILSILMTLFIYFFTNVKNSTAESY